MEPIDDKHLNEICLLGMGRKQCRYVIFSAPVESLCCARDDETLQFMLDAIGDDRIELGINCEGYSKRKNQSEE